MSEQKKYRFELTVFGPDTPNDIYSWYRDPVGELILMADGAPSHQEDSWRLCFDKIEKGWMYLKNQYLDEDQVQQLLDAGWEPKDGVNIIYNLKTRRSKLEAKKLLERELEKKWERNIAIGIIVIIVIGLFYLCFI